MIDTLTNPVPLTLLLATLSTMLLTAWIIFRKRGALPDQTPSAMTTLPQPWFPGPTSTELSISPPPSAVPQFQQAEFSVRLNPDALLHPKTQAPYWVPNTDVYIMDGTLIIEVELAGIGRENLELTVEGSRLAIEGYRQKNSENSKATSLVDEVKRGPFSLVIEVPPQFDLQAASAGYQNGFLHVRISRRPTTSHPDLIDPEPPSPRRFRPS